MQRESRMWSSEIILEAGCDKVIMEYFHCIQWGMDTGDHQPVIEKSFEVGFVKHF